jgi:hypothetical protein
MSEKTLTIPEIAPIFSYETEGGIVYIYVVKSGFATFTFITFDDTYAEFTYAVETLIAKPALVEKTPINVVKPLWDMVEQAEKVFYNPFIQNPFKLLKEDHEAMSKLTITVRKLLEASGE